MVRSYLCRSRPPESECSCDGDGSCVGNDSGKVEDSGKNKGSSESKCPFDGMVLSTRKTKKLKRTDLGWAEQERYTRNIDLMWKFVSWVEQMMERLSTGEKESFLGLREGFDLACMKLIDESMMKETKDKTFADRETMTGTIAVDKKTMTETVAKEVMVQTGFTIPMSNGGIAGDTQRVSYTVQTGDMETKHRQCQKCSYVEVSRPQLPMDRICFYCRKLGHLIANCRYRNRSCFYCGNYNHFFLLLVR